MSDESESEFSERIELIECSLDRFGTYLLGYADSLCKERGIDHQALFDDLWLYALNKLPKDKINHVGYLRLKLYQLFVDTWRKAKRDPVSVLETVPDTPLISGTEEPPSDENEEAIKERFFEEHPVDLTDIQKTVLFKWARYGMTAAEISAELSIPRSTVSDWVRLGRDAVIEYVESQQYREL